LPGFKLWGKNAFLGGKIFVFSLCFNKKYSGHNKICWGKKITWGALPPNATPWLRAWVQTKFAPLGGDSIYGIGMSF